jgi:hypothetical protein
MMKTLVACLATLALGTSLPVVANPTLEFNASPLNYQNSELNYDNSPLNYRNSPLNYDNSPLNPRSANGIYNSDGHRIGYEVQAPSGVTNIFDNNGNRIGYQPARRR